MLKVLIIENCETNKTMIERLFTDFNFNVVAKASSALEGIKLYEKFNPDLVTMDINISGKNGIPALKKIRDKHPNANILIITSLGEQKHLVQAIKYGAKGYVLKPINKDKMKESIEYIFPNIFTQTKNEDSLKSKDNLSIQNYESNIKDSLTELYTVQYMHDTIEHMIQIHNRYLDMDIGLLILNINNLSKLSKNFKGDQKEIILAQIARSIKDCIRRTDFPIKLTNDEFGLFIIGKSTNDMEIIANKLKDKIESIKNISNSENSKFEISIGISKHIQNEKLIAFIERTDKAVVRASKTEEKIFVSDDSEAVIESK